MKDQENGKVIDILDGWKVKQYLNKNVDRYYVTISQNSPLARKLGRHRLLRSHFVWMRKNDTWEIPLGYVVHHDDHDRHNDDPENLKLMTSAEHDRLHRKLAAINGATGFRGRQHSEETKAKMRKIAQARGNNDIWDCPKTHHTKETKALMSEKASGKSNPTYRADLDSEKITAFYKECRSLAETARHFNCSHSAIRYRLDPELYRVKASPLVGRERTYRFNDAEMFDFYKKNGAQKAAEKYGCSAATIYYRVKAFKNENHIR